MSDVVTDVLLSVFIAVGLVVIAVAVASWLTLRRLKNEK
tara:strand:+ start:413 stop:529 length:117 start_codon:yes stop_codon:yes gene_type:complete